MILLNGKAKTLNTLIELVENGDDVDKKIISTWFNADEIHNVKNTDPISKFKKAIQDVKKFYSGTPKPLFQKKNLKFITKAKKRLPRLYFIKGRESGRIRQQHPSGPLVATETNKVDYFFSTNHEKEDFYNRAGEIKANGQKFEPLLEFGSGISELKENYFHVEITYSDKDRTRIEKRHPSQGRVKIGCDAYNDENIKVIYEKVIGRCAHNT